MIQSFLKSHDSFLVVVHVNPDGDAIGSGLAMAHLLFSLGKTCTLVNDDPVPARFQFLPMAFSFRQTHDVQEAFSHVIFLDCADQQRIGNAAKLIKPDAIILNIDHHATNNHYGSLNLVDTTAASTTQIVYNLAVSLDISLNRDMAMCMYTGLLTDTGGFRYSNTTEAVHRMAAHLIHVGVDPYPIAEKALETMTLKQLEITKTALAHMHVTNEGTIAWMSISRQLMEQTSASEEDIDGLVHYARNIEGVEVGILFKQRSDQEVKVSLRSKTYIDVSAIAAQFGGGGHVRAAGCTIHASLEEAEKAVLEAVHKRLQEAASV